MVECSPPVGAKAVLIDDLAANGDSLKTAMQVLADEAQIQTVGIQTIVNWGFPAMRKNLEGTPVKALTSFPYILTHALAQSRISDNDMVELMAFYQNPKNPRLEPDDQALRRTYEHAFRAHHSGFRRRPFG